MPQEVSRLVEALNAFMHRLSGLMNTLNTLVADAAHQVRTPLASLRAQAEVALEEPDPERLHARIQRIHQNATHASQLINQLLMDATITHRLGKGARAPVGVAEAVNETRRRIGPLEARRLRIDIAPEVRRARIAGDRVALREMLRNLVDNALRYAPDGPVDIQATPVAGYRVALTVSDRGPGIADDEKEAVQQRFTRGRAGESLPGSGLGLAIVRSVAVAHGGSLWLQDRPGGGLSARVILPLARHHAGRRLAAWLGAACVAGLMLAGAPGDARAAGIPETVTRYPAPQPSARVLHHRRPDRHASSGAADPGLPVAAAGRERGLPGNGQPRTVRSHDRGRAEGRGRADEFGRRPADPPGQRRLRAALCLALRRQAAVVGGLAQQVYGFTFEPAVIVYNPRRYTEATVPRSRQDLLRALERDKDKLHGRVGTYDISASSVGYLMAEQDELVSSNFWGLANAFGQVGVRLAATSAEILDAIERDELDLGYNMLGSYALSRQAAGSDIGVVFPQDYVLVLARSVLIARRALTDLARQLVDWLLSPAGQQVASSHAALGSIMEDTPGRWTSEAVLARSRGIVQPVVLSPAPAGGPGPAPPFALRAELDPVGDGYAAAQIGLIKHGPHLREYIRFYIFSM